MYSRGFIIFCFFPFLYGCSGNFKSAIESIRIANEISDESNLTPDLIENTPYSSAVITVNNLPSIFMVLAFAEKNTYNDDYKLTWVASDNGTLVTENGRIVSSNGVPGANLESIHTVRNKIPLIGKEMQWQAFYDWSPGYRYHFSAKVKSTDKGSETVSNEFFTQKTDHWTETVLFDDLGYQFENQYWVVHDNKNTKPRVVKSIQYLGPNMHKITMLITRSYLEPETEQEQQSPNDQVAMKQ